MTQKLESAQPVDHISRAYPIGRHLADADKKCKRTLCIGPSVEHPQAHPSATCQQASHMHACAGVYRIMGWSTAARLGRGMDPRRQVFFLSAPLLCGSSQYLAQKEHAVTAHGQWKGPLLLQELHRRDSAVETPQRPDTEHQTQHVVRCPR
jgi:hypothetical protein